MLYNFRILSKRPVKIKQEFSQIKYDFLNRNSCYYNDVKLNRKYLRCFQIDCQESSFKNLFRNFFISKGLC